MSSPPPISYATPDAVNSGSRGSKVAYGFYIALLAISGAVAGLLLGILLIFLLGVRNDALVYVLWGLCVLFIGGGLTTLAVFTRRSRAVHLVIGCLGVAGLLACSVGAAYCFYLASIAPPAFLSGLAETLLGMYLAAWAVCALLLAVGATMGHLSRRLALRWKAPAMSHGVAQPFPPPALTPPPPSG